MNEFDPVAAEFDRFRALPDGVAAAFRDAVQVTLGQTPGARLLEVGAGTGRFGTAFGEDGGNYIGVDSSGSMLRQFAARSPGSRPRLVQADGCALPFADGTFDVALLLHVLSGVPRWRWMLAEACRVLREGGSFIIGGRQSARQARCADAGRLNEMMTAEGLFAGRRGAAPRIFWCSRQGPARDRTVAAAGVVHPRGFSSAIPRSAGSIAAGRHCEALLRQLSD